MGHGSLVPNVNLEIAGFYGCSSLFIPLRLMGFDLSCARCCSMVTGPSRPKSAGVGSLGGASGCSAGDQDPGEDPGDLGEGEFP